MQKRAPEKIYFENIGGSFQFRAKSAADLKKILSLDETVWAALCVPAASLNGDPAFFKALDGDADGMIRADEVYIIETVSVMLLPSMALRVPSRYRRSIRIFLTANSLSTFSQPIRVNLTTVQAWWKCRRSGPNYPPSVPER